MARALKTQEIREEFVRFFVDRGHRHIPSSPLVPIDDPTLLFTSAGMVQFKTHFASPKKLEYTRAVTVQKCFRATDLEQVGHTPRHLSFFEMLGNFSFGDYFKREAIQWAWEFVIDVLEMDPKKLWVTVYLEDDEAAEIWVKDVGIPSGRLLRLGKEHNFWGPAGATGACGPCSEIYMDLGRKFGCKKPNCKPGCDCDRYQEFWNLVFPQFDQDESGNLNPLPRPGIDTGLGLERLAQLLQGKSSVFETDEFLPLRDAVFDMVPDVDPDREEHRVSLNIVAEHARAITMLFAEGIYPSNEGRGYVARRILRRAARRGKLLGLSDPFLYKLTGVVVDRFQAAYPDLKEGRERIAKVCRAEETRFLETLEMGIKRFEEVVEKTRAAGKKTLSGGDVFTLYDTHGFPPDLTAEMALEQGLNVDQSGFESEMEAQVERSRSDAFIGDTENALPWEWIGDKNAPHSVFVGYDTLEVAVNVVARRQSGEGWEFLLDTTPFYAEGGGQVADRGSLIGENGFRVEITGVVRQGDHHIHKGSISLGASDRHKGAISDGASFEQTKFTARVDAAARRDTERNHTATHLLHAALKRVVGEHVTQAGSLVAPDRLRFDFNHFSPLTAAQIRAIEDDVNDAVLVDLEVKKQVSTMEEAKEAGAVAMFGEKYGDRVRQVFVTREGDVTREGGDVTGENGDVTRELCGGCHVRRTGEIGFFRIVSQESVAAGIRRVEAVTGWNAVRYQRDEDAAIRRLEEVTNTSSRQELEARVQGVVEENEKLRKELAALQTRLVNQRAGDILDQVETVDGVSFLATEFPVSDLKALRQAADQLRQRMKSGVGLLAARTGDKAALLVFVTDDVVKKKGIHADRLVKEVAEIVGGGGGGKKDLATAGGKHPEKIPEALREGREVLERMLSET